MSGASVDEVDICEYCHKEVSMHEWYTEYGKHWHPRCYTYKLGKDVDAYKKKWINEKLSEGDKADLVEKYNLYQELKSESTVFEGLVPVGERQRHTPLKTEKRMLYLPGGIPVMDSTGKPIFVEEMTSSVDVRYLLFRPRVRRIKNPLRPKLIKSAEEILQIEEGS